MVMKATALPLESIQVSAYTIPTDFPESGGTLEWSSTTLMLIEMRGGGKTGIGFTYADTATARLIQDRLAFIKTCTSLIRGRFSPVKIYEMDH